jgi:hypothetical protein
MSYDWPGIVALLLWAGLTFALFAARHRILAHITNSVQHGFNVELEKVRTELRASEERLKSELRDKEAEISSLRANVLSGSASRQALLDKRRFEAVERVWTAVNDLAPVKNISRSLTVLNMKEVAKEVHDPRMQRVLSTLDTMAPPPEKWKNVARDERPFLPDLAWAYFHAYQTTILAAYIRFAAFKTGLEDPDRYLSFDNLRNVLKAALPHQSKWIDQNEPETYYYLLEELEPLLLAELRKVLDAKETDQASIEKARAIMDALKKGEEEQAKAAATRG